MIKQKLTLFLLLTVITVNGYAAQAGGFDEVCRIYTEAQNSSMQGEQLSTYIFDNVQARVTLTDAIQAHSAIFNIDPAERYSIFKQSAELSLKSKWDCPAMKTLMQK
jgi:hypothetical protein